MLRHSYKRFQEDEKEKILEEVIPLIKHLANKVSKGNEDESLLEDLISAGILGFLEAIEKYEPERGIKLNTYAYLRIKGAMLDELRSRDYFSRDARSKHKKIEETIRELEVRLGRAPEDEEVAKNLHISTEQYRKMLRDYKHLQVISVEDLNEMFGGERSELIKYVITGSENVEESTILREIETILARKIEKLPEKQRLVLTLYYYEDLNMKEIAKVLNITEARVSQLHTQAIINLRVSVKKYFT